MAAHYDEIEIEDMEWNEELDAFTYSCPCGDLFQITMVRRAHIAGRSQLLLGYVAAVIAHAPLMKSGPRNSVRVQDRVTVQKAIDWASNILRCKASCRCAAQLQSHVSQRSQRGACAGGAGAWRGDRTLPQLLADHCGHI